MQQEDQIYKQLNYGLLQRLLAYLKPYLPLVALALVISVLSAVLGPLRPYLTSYAVDAYVVGKKADQLIWFGAIIVLSLLAHGAMQVLLSVVMQNVGQRVLNDVRMTIFRHIQKMSLRFFDHYPVGRLVTRVTSDVEALNELFSSGVVMMFSDILLIAFIFVFMALTSWQLTLAAIFVLPLLFIATSIFRKYVRVAYTEVRRQIARMNSFLNEYITGISTIQLFRQEEVQSSKFDEINSAHRDVQNKTVFYYATFYPVVEFLSALALCAVLWIAVPGIFDGWLTIGVLIAFIQYAEMFFRPIRDLTEKYNTLQSAMAASERIFGLLDTEILVADNANAQHFEGLKREIEFRQLSFSYVPDKLVLDNVSFTIGRGETLAIVGATGSGKTTIINMLCRFYEYQGGDIVIDGRSIRDYTQKSIRSKIALVLQDVFLFSRSIRDNITMGRPDISFEQVEQAARDLGAHEFIEALDRGYDTPLIERAANLSVGQKQLISFCRALVTNPDILILDEATSSIDTHTEQLIERSIERLLKGRTSVVIAHRLSTVQRADKILVLHHGRVKEIGTHQDLLAQNGHYARLYKLQYSLQTSNVPAEDDSE